MEIRKKEQNEPDYPSNTALKIGAAIVAAGILLGSAAGCDKNSMTGYAGDMMYETPDGTYEYA